MMELAEIEWGGMDWLGLTQDREKWRGLVNGAMNLQFLLNDGRLLSGYITGGLLSSIQLHRVSYIMVSLNIHTFSMQVSW
jgi:hypothetical protein